MNKTWKSALGDILKPLCFFFYPTSWNAREAVLVFSSRCFFFTDDVSGYEWKAGARNDEVFKNRAFSCQSSTGPTVGFDKGGETSQGELSELPCRGGKDPEGGSTPGWVTVLAVSCCTWISSSRRYPLALHHLSLRIQPQETDCLRALQPENTVSVAPRHTGSTVPHREVDLWSHNSSFP